MGYMSPVCVCNSLGAGLAFLSHHESLQPEAKVQPPGHTAWRGPACSLSLTFPGAEWNFDSQERLMTATCYMAELRRCLGCRQWPRWPCLHPGWPSHLLEAPCYVHTPSPAESQRNKEDEERGWLGAAWSQVDPSLLPRTLRFQAGCCDKSWGAYCLDQCSGGVLWQNREQHLLSSQERTE